LDVVGAGEIVVGAEK